MQQVVFSMPNYFWDLIKRIFVIPLSVLTRKM